MKRIYILIALFALAASCQKLQYDAPGESQNSEADGKVLLKSLLAGRDTKWTVDELSVPSMNAGWYEVGSDKELAFLLEFGSTAGEKYRLVNNIDFSVSEIADKLSGEIGVEKFENFEFNGNGFKISGAELPMAAGLFSRVKDSKIYDLTIENCAFGSESNVSNLLGTGALAGHITGSVTVSGVNVANCEVKSPCKVGGLVGSVTDADCSFTSCNVTETSVETVYVKGVSGWCGGFVGFVGREIEKSTESVVSFVAENCSVTGGSVKAYMESSTRYSGTFLGTLNGYDSNESVDIKDCQVSTTFVGLDSNASSYVSIYPDRKIGGHKYMNGYVCFDGLKYVTPWDGTTTTQPKLVDGTYQVYTGEELAWFQGKTVTEKIQICDDIDLGGHLFAPIYKAQYLDGFKSEGENYEIRNLKVVRENCGKEDGAAFIRQASGTSVHKNITFRGADIKATHDESADHGNAYCATLCGNMTGTYTMENVHAYDGKLYGVNKMGGLLGRVYATATIKNCSVSGYYIENYQVDKPEDFGNSLVSVIFYPQGEVGGMIGFIQGNATVTDCHVYNTEINAYGQNDKNMIIINVPGRHVGTVIGDIRVGNSSTAFSIVITNTGSDTETVNLCKSHRLDQQNGATFVGKCYYAQTSDQKGTVTVDGNPVTIK